MNSLYEISGISKQGFFKVLHSEFKEDVIKEEVIELVKIIRKTHPKMGSRPMYHKLLIKGIGINKFETYVSELGLGVQIKKKRIITTESRHRFKKYENLTYGLILTDVNQVWCSDITYFITPTEVYYIVMIEDVYSRRILGWKASNNMYASNNMEVLKQAFKIRGNKIFNGLIHHSDKGSQYGCTEYVKMLNKAEIKISMAKNSLENPYAERLNGIIKNDYLETMSVSGFKDFSQKLDKVVWLYNNERPHSELDYLTPVKFEEKLLLLSANEHPTITLHDFRRMVL